MKAVTYQGVKTVRVKEVDDPKIHKPDDIIVKITSSAICGSDLHLIHGMIPNLPENYIIGHEPIGFVEAFATTDIKRDNNTITFFDLCDFRTHFLLL